ncbi:MAG: HNH endonuclease, partial [Phormidesmis sp.]
RQKGGTDRFDNLQPLHRHCHNAKTARDNAEQGADDNSRTIEEPDARKRASPVLNGRVTG